MRKENKKAGIQKELEQIAPRLAQLSQRVPKDDVPPRYFRELPDSLWQRIQEEELSERKAWSFRLPGILSSFRQRPVAIGLVAIALLLIGVWIFRDTSRSYWMAQQDGQLPQLTEIPDEVLYDYILEHIASYNTADFADFEQAVPLNNLLPISSDEAALDDMIDEYLEQLDDMNFKELL